MLVGVGHVTNSGDELMSVSTGGVMLLVGFGSPVDELTVAMLVSVPLAGTVTVKVTLVTEPLARSPKFQDTPPPVIKPPPVALTKTTPFGRLSVTTTLLAMDGPRLVTVTVYVRLEPAVTLPEPLLKTARSACVAMTVIVTVAVEQSPSASHSW